MITIDRRLDVKNSFVYPTNLFPKKQVHVIVTLYIKIIELFQEVVSRIKSQITISVFFHTMTSIFPLYRSMSLNTN